MAFLFQCNHVPTELVSTDKYPLMCRLHTPVYLFVSSRDESFVRWHYGVSLSVDNEELGNGKLKMKLNFFFKYNVYLSGFQTEDGTHPTFIVFICMRCGENFDRS